ncbi:MAG: FAD-dependent oxidoreductase [Dysgonamonadaceae bacterium]|jgi:hypothetical protein|nr:FAD-dependent oxidoreductase [Dysgonamonadaceae bacterium]
MKRRQFIKASGMCVLTSSFAVPTTNSCSPMQGNNITEKARETPVKGHYDIVVCGSGPAGVVTAIEAARKGASVLLVEMHGCLGGTWTSGQLSWILDYKNKHGFIRQIENDLRNRGAICPIPTSSSLSFDIEAMKLLLEEYCLDAGVVVRLFTQVVGAIKQNNRLSYVITESKSGREAWGGKIFVDATGDGDLATHAGCGYDFGNAENHLTQPFSLLTLVGGIQFEDIKEYTRWTGDTKSNSKKLLLELLEKQGCQPSYKNPSLHPIRDDMFMLMANHEYGYHIFNADHLTTATLHARKELHQIIAALRSAGGPWTNLKLISTPEQIGVREGRRIHGLYSITVQDVVEGRSHNDAVCKATFGVDVHSTSYKTDENLKSYSHGHKTKPYDIPLRALIAKDVSGLMMAGRCISGDFFAHASYRVTGNAVPMGEAVGKVAAYAALNNILPQDVPYNEFAIVAE